MIKHLLQQIKQRRLALGLKQSDMTQRIGVSRQQYQAIESKGNPRLETLELIASGLNSELMLIPREKLPEILAVLGPQRAGSGQDGGLSENPWQDMLDDKS